VSESETGDDAAWDASRILKMNDWENEPATEKQKAKLRYFGCTWAGEISKGEASRAIDECVRTRPDVGKAYQDRSATPGQLREIRQLLMDKSKTPNDYAKSGKGLTYREAKELIEDLKSEAEEAELDRMDKEYLIDVDSWADLYPGLTWKRVQAAAESLDKTRTGWRNNEKHIDIMLGKVAEQNPQLLERWSKKSAPKQRGRRRKKNSSAGVLIFFIVVIWIAYKIISKNLH
jgi:hypothetical protein